MIDGRKLSVCAPEAIRQTALRRVPEVRMSYHQSHADQTLPETLTAFREVTLILSRFLNITVFCFSEQVYVVSIAVGLETRKKSLALEDHTSQANARALSSASFDGTINNQPSSQNSANGFVEMLRFCSRENSFCFIRTQCFAWVGQTQTCSFCGERHMSQHKINGIISSDFNDRKSRMQHFPASLAIRQRGPSLIMTL